METTIITLPIDGYPKGYPFVIETMTDEDGAWTQIRCLLCELRGTTFFDVWHTGLFSLDAEAYHRFLFAELSAKPLEFLKWEFKMYQRDLKKRFPAGIPPTCLRDSPKYDPAAYPEIPKAEFACPKSSPQKPTTEPA